MGKTNLERKPRCEKPEVIHKSDIYNLMADQARQSFFQLENITAALDSKVFGMVTADALLFSVFAYISQPLSDALFYIPMALIVLSFISLLVHLG
jgi:hypothetical protein